jgi:hypothetical protein
VTHGHVTHGHVTHGRDPRVRDPWTRDPRARDPGVHADHVPMGHVPRPHTATIGLSLSHTLTLSHSLPPAPLLLPPSFCERTRAHARSRICSSGGRIDTRAIKSIHGCKAASTAVRLLRACVRVGLCVCVRRCAYAYACGGVRMRMRVAVCVCVCVRRCACARVGHWVTFVGGRRRLRVAGCGTHGLSGIHALRRQGRETAGYIRLQQARQAHTRTAGGCDTRGPR